jgi:hypothetical protein
MRRCQSLRVWPDSSLLDPSRRNLNYHHDLANRLEFRSRIRTHPGLDRRAPHPSSSFTRIISSRTIISFGD